MSNLVYVFKSLPYGIFALVFLAGILLVLFGCYIPKLNVILAFLKNRIATGVCVFILSIFFTLNISKLTGFMSKIAAKNELTRKELDIMLKEEKVKNEALKTEVENLKHAAMNVQSFSEISELNLVKTDIKTTTTHYESLESPNPRTGKAGKEYWLVTNYDFQGVKYGIDINAVSIAVVDNELHVYGLDAKYTGTEYKSNPKDVLSEIRSYTRKESGVHINTKVIDNQEAEKDRLEDKYHADDEDRIINSIDQFEWIRNNCVNMGQVIIKNYLSPLHMNIVFEEPDKTNPQAEKIQDFLNHELEKKLNLAQ